MRSKNLVSPNTTEKPSAASKNISKGLWCEDIAKDHLKREGWNLLFQRKKLVHGEVDLIFSQGTRLLLVEVKSLHDEWMIFERIGQRQMQKLQHNLLWLQFHKDNKNKQIEACVCFVSNDKQVQLIYI